MLGAGKRARKIRMCVYVYECVCVCLCMFMSVYVCVCVCVCICVNERQNDLPDWVGLHAGTRSCVCVCVCVYVCVCVREKYEMYLRTYARLFYVRTIILFFSV